MMVFNGCAWEGMTSLGPHPAERTESEAGGSWITPDETCLGLFCLRNEGAVRARMCMHTPMHVYLVPHRRLPD